jgi:hypothetical protein
MHRLKYVGPGDIREVSSRSPPGTPIRSNQELLFWLAHNIDDEGGWCTFVISLGGDLVIAPRRSEHVACAAGLDVLAAGEIRFGGDGAVAEVTNNSTGYCPPELSWHAVSRALDAAEIRHPGRFTFLARFRRCQHCGERNLVKDDWYVCAICDADLPAQWNFDG